MADVRRIYAFSDTYGRSKNPFVQDDADALLSTDFRSFPLLPVRREFDIYGREAVTGHIVRLTFELHDAVLRNKCMTEDQKKEFAGTITGLFINAAPRTDKNENGAPFYLITAGNIRIVTTNLDCLSAVKERIQTIHRMPNEGHDLFGPTEQFRSSYTPSLLLDTQNLPLVEEKIDIIPNYPEDRWELAYVDRFGNLVTYSKHPERHWEEAMSTKRPDGRVKVVIGNVSQALSLTTSLRDAEPGDMVVYNNGNIDILRKWEEDEDEFTRLYRSAYFQFAKPRIGMRITIPKKIAE